jgi:hypothetical protein
MSKIIGDLTNAGVLVPKDARELASDRVFRRELRHIRADWVNQPIALTMSGIPADSSEDGEIPAADPVGAANTIAATGGDSKAAKMAAAARKNLVKTVSKLMRYRDALSDAEAESAAQNFRAGKAKAAKRAVPEVNAEDVEPEVTTITHADLKKLGITLK